LESREINQPYLSADITIQGLTFGTTDAAGYSLSQTAGSLTLTNVGTGASSAIYALNSSGINTISTPIILGGAAATTATFYQVASGTLNVSGNISSTNAISGLRLEGSAYPATITLSGSNSYAGNTTIIGNSKTYVNINSAYAVSSGTLITESAATMDNTSGAAVTLATNNNVTLGADLNFAGSNDLNWGSGVVKFTTGINVSAGTLTIGSLDTASTLTTFFKKGAGTLAITGAAGANFQGGVTYTSGGGSLIIGNKSSLGTGTLTVSAGPAKLSASADLSGTNAVANNINVSNSNFVVEGNNNLTLSGTISGTSALRAVTVSTSGTVAFSNTSNSYLGATLITGTNTVFEVTKLANGGTNSSMGASTNADTNLNISNGTTLRYLGTGDSTDRLFRMTGVSGAVITLDASGSGALEFTNTGNVSHDGSNRARTLVLTGSNGGNNKFGLSLANNAAGVISVTKNGAGTWVLSSTSTYTGATTVNAGTLVVSGGISNSSAVTVGAGGQFRYNGGAARTGAITLNGAGNSSRAVLSGTGAINVAVTLDNVGDTLSPGNSPGIQDYTVSQSWDAFTYLWETNNFSGTTAGTDFDKIAITGDLTLNGAGTFQLDLRSLTAGNVAGDVPNFSETNTSWTILSTTAGISGFDAGNWTILTGDFDSSPAWAGGWSITESGGNLILNYGAIPEPSTLLLAMGGLSMMTLLRRRRRS